MERIRVLVTEKGQVTIPKPIRNAASVAVGSEVEISLKATASSSRPSLLASRRIAAPSSRRPQHGSGAALDRTSGSWVPTTSWDSSVVATCPRQPRQRGVPGVLALASLSGYDDSAGVLVDQRLGRLHRRSKRLARLGHRAAAGLQRTVPAARQHHHLLGAFDSRARGQRLG